MTPASSHEFDVCLSFAGDDREYVEAVASELRQRGVRPFYDKYERSALWGKDLYEHLDYVYRTAARFCVLFASKHYAEKVWPSHERKSAQARALQENHEYILPARFDSTEIPGLRETVGYVSLQELSPSDLADLIVEKLGPRQTERFFPPEPDLLYEAMDLDEDGEEAAHYLASRFFRVLQRMSEEEMAVVVTALLHGCPAELPENVHISLDLLRRETRFPQSQVIELLRAVLPLGFNVTLRDPVSGGAHELEPNDKMVVLKWSHLTDFYEGEPVEVAYHTVHCAVEGYCEEHGLETLMRLDFSQLASATATVHEH